MTWMQSSEQSLTAAFGLIQTKSGVVVRMPVLAFIVFIYLLWRCGLQGSTVLLFKQVYNSNWGLKQHHDAEGNAPAGEEEDSANWVKKAF